MVCWPIHCWISGEAQQTFKKPSLIKESHQLIGSTLSLTTNLFFNLETEKMF